MYQWIPVLQLDYRTNVVNVHGLAKLYIYCTASIFECPANVNGAGVQRPAQCYHKCFQHPANVYCAVLNVQLVFIVQDRAGVIWGHI